MKLPNSNFGCLITKCSIDITVTGSYYKGLNTICVISGKYNL